MLAFVCCGTRGDGRVDGDACQTCQYVEPRCVFLRAAVMSACVLSWFVFVWTSVLVTSSVSDYVLFGLCTPVIRGVFRFHALTAERSELYGVSKKLTSDLIHT